MRFLKKDAKALTEFAHHLREQNASPGDIYLVDRAATAARNTSSLHIDHEDIDRVQQGFARIGFKTRDE